MNKNWKLYEKILNGEKVIESRWYKNKVKPWNFIKAGDVLYFKNTSNPILLKSKVTKIEQFESLTSDSIKNLLKKHYKELGLNEDQINIYNEKFKDKKYCILIYFNELEIVTPFLIDKTGFGAQSAWISIENIAKIKK